MSKFTDEIVVTANRDLAAAQGITTPDEYSLDDITLITPNGNLNIKALMVELSYYEDIFRGSVTGHVLLNDATSLVDVLKLTGHEFLKLKFRKSKTSSDDSAINKTFRIFRIGEREKINQDAEMYSIHFCSEEMMLSEQIKISKSYKGKTISEMVNDLLVNEMKVDPQKIVIYPTTGTYDFIIPYKKPFEAINWLSNYAISPEYNAADYVFYESRLGFTFVSLKTLYELEPYKVFSYRPKGFTDLTSDKGMANSLSNIKSYKFLDTFDTLYGISKGVFANRLLTIDPMTRTFRDTLFSYVGTNKEQPDTMNKGPLINNYKNKLGLQSNECYDSSYKVMLSNADQKTANGISGKPDAVAQDIRAEKYVPYRTSQLAASNYSRLQFSVSGDPLLSVGRMIKVSLPSNMNSDGTSTKSGERDRMHSGNYLITAIRHIIDVNMKYDTIVEASKDSFGTNSTNYSNDKMTNIKRQL